MIASRQCEVVVPDNLRLSANLPLGAAIALGNQRQKSSTVDSGSTPIAAA